MTIDVLSLAKTLIQCPSITPEDAGCQTLIAKQLTALGFHTETLLFNKVHNLWARYGTTSPLLVFAGHTDVVPPGPLEAWRTPPFMPTEKEGYLYGRGAADMKGALAAMITAVCNVLRTQPTIKGSIGFLITSDEEGEAFDGTQQVIETLRARNEQIDCCIVGEPCSREQLGDAISIGRRGSLHGQLTIHGKQGHIARPALASNPIHLSCAPLQTLIQTVWDQGNDFFPPTSFQISNIHSGSGALNVIPGLLNCAFNFRYSTAITVNALQQRVETILKTQGLSFDLVWKIGAEPFLTHSGKLLKSAQTVIQQITGTLPRLSTEGGTSDGRFIAPTGAEVIEIGALCHTAHHANECIALTDLQTLTQIYEGIIQNLLSE